MLLFEDLSKVFRLWGRAVGMLTSSFLVSMEAAPTMEALPPCSLIQGVSPALFMFLSKVATRIDRLSRFKRQSGVAPAGMIGLR